ncbi:hypothetical protein Tco_0347631 [Tanacetum coccineum]
MSDSEDSTVTYTAASSLFGGLSDIGSLGVEPQSPPPPDFVPEPIYPEFMPIEDEILPAKVQPLPVAVSPTADSPGYVLESDPEEDPEEDYDEDLEEDPADYPDDGGDDGDDEDEPSMRKSIEELKIEAERRRRRSTQLLPTLQLLLKAMIRLRAEAASTSHSLPLLSLSPIPTPTSSPPLLLPSTNHREDRLEVTLPPRKRLGIALGPNNRSERARLLLLLDRLEVVAQQAVITELRATDRRRQAVFTEMMAADRRMQKQFIEALKLLKRLQTQMTEFRETTGTR